MVLKKIISGGQQGADLAGLYAAQIFGIETGGFAPKGYKTSEGNMPELLQKFGLEEINGGYKDRTYKNVEFADGTIRFAFDFYTPGEMCTLNAIKKYGKPYLDIGLGFPENLFTDLEVFNDSVKATALWIKQNNIEVLNIAGNSEHRNPNVSIFELVLTYLSKVFYYLAAKP